MKEISRQNIVLSTVAVIMLVLILTIGFFAFLSASLYVRSFALSME
jgi:hypothetical protein